MSNDPRDLLGRTLGGYQLDHILGGGVMGAVFLGHAIADPTHIVAIKVLQPTWQALATPGGQLRQRFANEIALLQQLRHPHILRMIASGDEDGYLYMILPYIAGKTLAERIAAGPLPLDEAVRIIEQVAEALAYAHARDVIHRDIKPSNILLDDQENVYLADFSIAKLFAQEGMTLTGTGMVLGTPGYMAPEQALGREATVRSDQYSLGVVAYELVTGKTPLRANPHGPPPAPQTLRRDLTPALNAAILRALAPDPLDRYPSISAFAAAFAAGPAPHLPSTIAAPAHPPTQIAAAPPMPPSSSAPLVTPPPPRTSRRQFVSGALLGAGIAASGIGAIILTQNHGTSSRSTAGPSATNTSSATSTPAPSTPQPSIVPQSLATLGFTGWQKNGTNYILPPTAPVAAGPFMMGSDPKVDTQASSDEYLHQVQVDAFALATYPVTVAEYALAVQAQAVPTPQSVTYPADYIYVAPIWRGKTFDWAAQQTRPDHPVVMVSWLNSLAYVQWLAQISGQAWRLPTEAEWEKAARWDAATQHARIYPWGDQWDQARANTYGIGIHDTTTVGAYASKGDVSPYGCHDMAGNVWQWCSSIYRSDAYQNDSNHENITDTTSDRVGRGGSWWVGPRVARAAFRDGSAPGGVWVNLGFRLARALPPGSR